MEFYSSLTLKYIKKNKKRTIVTIIGIILASVLISAIGTIGESFIKFNRDTFIEDYGDYDGVFNGIKGNQLDGLEKSVYVEKSVVEKDIGYVQINKEEKEYLKLKAFSHNPKIILPYKIKKGEFPKNSKEIAICTEVLNKIGEGLDIGSTIELQLENNNGVIKKDTFQISAIIDKISDINKGKLEYYGVTYLDNLDCNGYYNVYLTLKDKKDIKNQFEKIAEDNNIKKITMDDGKDKFPIQYNEKILATYGQSSNNKINKMIWGFVSFIGILVLITTIVTVYNSLNISILERKKAFSIMASIGATKGQIRKLVFREAMIMSVIAIPIGILCGTVAPKLLFKIISVFFVNSSINQINLQCVITLKVIIISFLVVFLTVLISAFVPANRASKITPIEGIKETGTYKTSKIKSGKLIKKIFGVEGQLAYKNLKRNKRKYRTTLVSLIFSIVLFISFNGSFDLVSKSFKTLFGEGGFDFAVSYNKNTKNETLKNIDNISSIKELSNLNTIFGNINFKNEDFSESLKKKVDVEKLKSLRGSLVATENIEEYKNFNEDQALKENGVIFINNGVIMESSSVEELEPYNFKVGDYITININDEPVKLKILKISKEMPLGVNNLGIIPTFITSKNTYNNIINNLEKQGKNPLKVSTIFIKSTDLDHTKKQLENIKTQDDSIEISDLKEEMKSYKQTENSIKVFFLGFIIVVTLIGVSNIVNTMQTNIALRKREFAIIQAIGVTPKGLNKMLYFESIFYGIMSLIIGVPLGILFCYLLYKCISINIVFSFILPIKTIIICSIAIFIIVFLSAYFPIRKLKKENIIENIKMENV